MKVWDPVNEEWVYIPEDEVPMWGFDVPSTGDGSRTALWAALTAGALGGAVRTARSRKRKEEN